MTLTWPHLNDLAAALAAAHDGVDRLELTPEDLRQLVADTSGRDIAARLTADELSSLKWLWMSHADGQPPRRAVVGEAG